LTEADKRVDPQTFKSTGALATRKKELAAVVIGREAMGQSFDLYEKAKNDNKVLSRHHSLPYTRHIVGAK
jgi:hypothetical protein